MKKFFYTIVLLLVCAFIKTNSVFANPTSQDFFSKEKLAEVLKPGLNDQTICLLILTGVMLFFAPCFIWYKLKQAKPPESE